MPYVLMKAFALAPRKFDGWMRLASFGRLDRVREAVTADVSPGTRVLELGCGTGRLSVSLADRGVHVTGIDTSEEMLAVGRERAGDILRPGVLDLKRVSSLEIEDTFVPDSFDTVISVLMFSELSDAEVDCTLRQCRRLLDRAGRLIIVDEIAPDGALPRAWHTAVNYPARLAVYLVLQAKDLKSSSLAKKILYYAIEFPLMLLTFAVVPAPSRPVRDLPARMDRAGFRVTSRRAFGRRLALIQAEAK